MINAVNALRSANGLPAYNISPILMFTAQNQADFMAANSIVTHSGPGGIGLTDRLLAAGYPLAGDLSLGGFRAENIISGREDISAQSAVDQWTGDGPHLITMLSTNLTEIGAGVAFANGSIYFVIDAARPTTSGAPQVVTSVPGGGSAVPGGGAIISPVVVSTPKPDGDIIHEVRSGQSLSQISIAYEVKIDVIKRLNGLVGNDIYPGNLLLIKKVTLMPTVNATETVVNTSTPTFAATDTPIPTQPTITSTVENSAPQSGQSSSYITIYVIGIVLLALVIGIVSMRFGHN